MYSVSVAYTKQLGFFFLSLFQKSINKSSSLSDANGADRQSS